jgi:sugar phosphate isomerase/epimerase
VDDAKRRANFTYVCERLALADEIGARCCVDYIGTLDPGTEFWPHPENLSSTTFDLAVDVVRRILKEVKPLRAKFCLEMMQWTFPDSPESYVRLIEAVDHTSFAVHLDPVNLIVSPRLYFDNGSLIRECFNTLGKWIVSCHAKDIILRNRLALHMDETRPGTGNLDYTTYLTELRRLPGEVPIMLEHLSSADEYARARDYLFGLERDL